MEPSQQPVSNQYAPTSSSMALPSSINRPFQQQQQHHQQEQQQQQQALSCYPATELRRYPTMMMSAAPTNTGQSQICHTQPSDYLLLQQQQQVPHARPAGALNHQAQYQPQYYSPRTFTGASQDGEQPHQYQPQSQPQGYQLSVPPPMVAYTDHYNQYTASNPANSSTMISQQKQSRFQLDTNSMQPLNASNLLATTTYPVEQKCQSQQQQHFTSQSSCYLSSNIDSQPAFRQQQQPAILMPLKSATLNFPIQFVQQQASGQNLSPTFCRADNYIQTSCLDAADHCAMSTRRNREPTYVQSSNGNEQLVASSSSSVSPSLSSRRSTASMSRAGPASSVLRDSKATQANQIVERNNSVRQGDDKKLLRRSTSRAVDSDSASKSVLKSCLSQLILASNVPLAYTIILVAFLITMIAATSIITILTIVLTLTGYTAYPITENTFNTSLAIGVVCASFALALVTASLIVWRRHCQAAYYYLDEPNDASRGTNSPQLSETYDDSEYGSIPVNDWQKHVQKLHADSDIGFAREFEQIQQANQKQSLALTCDHSQLAENKHKNRYINIVAYDHTRVILRPPLGGQKKPGYDYINANFIDGYNKPRAYIGTQGPLVSTFDDYWRMIWEQRVVIIVMITNLQERGRRKCDMYWPKEGTETYGYVQVKLLQEVVMATYTLRTFTIRNLKMKKRAGGAERTVYQYHYTNWPDHGVPDHPLPVLSFVRKSAAANPPGAGAIICHCSAGCGRSGTYIVIDAMLKQIRHKQSINVVDFLKHIRSQRNYLVQTEEQYVFIHDALVEAIESGETEIPSNFIAKYIQLLQTGGGGAFTCASANSTTKLLNNGSNYSLLNGLVCQSPMAAGNNNNNNSLSVVNAASHDSQQLISTSNSNLLLAAGASAKSLGSQATTVSRSQSSSGQWSLLERQYRLVASFKAKDFCVVSALKPCNKNKNRTLNLIPLEAHRVHITAKPGTDGSDYINATFLMGFNHLHEFIATQHPVQETFSDFWQMVYDHNSQTIVLLTQMAGSGGGGGGTNSDDPAQLAKEYPQFWPQKEDEVDYGSFKVKLIQESTLMKAENGGLIITRDFIMRSNQDDYELQTRIIHCPGWPECCGPLSAVFDLIQVVQQATQQQSSQHRLHDAGRSPNSGTVTIGQEHEPQNGGPIIVVDKFGGTEAATFAVLTTLFKQINFEDAVDVYMYAKLAHLRRPGIWSSQDDYLFLYRAMENYASSLLQAQQQQQQQHQQQSSDKSAIAASLTAPISLANLHNHQTMTLDRHGRHNKSTASQASNALKSSTMKRTPSNKNSSSSNSNKTSKPVAATNFRQQNQQQQQQAPLVNASGTITSPAAHLNHALVANEFLAIKANNQLKTMHANNSGNQHQHQHPQQSSQMLVDQNHNSLVYSPMMQHQQQQQQINNSLAASHQKQQQQQQMPKGSPYNSAASIGAGSHQHLLAANSLTSAATMRQQVAAPGHQQNMATADHYNLYSMQ